MEEQKNIEKTKYSHAFLVGSLNSIVKPEDLDTNIWERQILTPEKYNKLLSVYYQSLVDSMAEAEVQTRPEFLKSVCHYSISIDEKGEKKFDICLTKGMAELPYDYRLSLCKIHLYFFPNAIVLFVLEIDDTRVDLDLMTLGHGSLINLKFGKTGNEKLLQQMLPLLDLTEDKQLKNIVKDGNNMKIFQVIELDDKEPDDKKLFEIGTFIPIGAVGGTDANSPSKAYFDRIIKDNSISVFYNWKALALVDSFTVLGVKGYNKWTWENLYFPLIYLRCIYEKTFCFSRNSAYRLGKAVNNISQEIVDMEKFYFYNNISYNFLPEMLYDFMVKGIGLKEEREEISKQIKERAKEDEKKQKEEAEERKRIQKEQDDQRKQEEDKRFNRILAGVSIFAVISVIWDFCSIVKDAFGFGEYDPESSYFSWGFIVLGIVVIVILWFKILRERNDKANTNK